MKPVPDYYAKEVLNSVRDSGDENKDTVIEVLCSENNAQIRKIMDFYKTLSGVTFPHDLQNMQVPDDFRNLLVSLSHGNRDENPAVDETLALSDARKLIETDKYKTTHAITEFFSILGTRSYPQLRQTFLKYKNLLNGLDIEKKIEVQFSGPIRNLFLAIVKFAKSKSDFFAERLHKSMVGTGTRNRALIRIIVSRSEIDLGDIKRAFNAKYPEGLKDWIIGDTSGSYRQALLSLIAE